MKGIVRSLLVALCLFSAVTISQAQKLEDCYATYTISEGTTLANVADIYFGDLSFRYAILLATNRRAGNEFPFIRNSNQLPVGESLCVPKITEAIRERNRFLTYLNAVRDMALPEPFEITNDLTPIDTSKKSVIVSSWVRQDQAAGYKPGATITARGDTWVTLAPKVKDFCTEHSKVHGSDLSAITLRLEQRIGLAPHSSKTHFVEFEVQNPGNPAQIFRPCASWDVTTKSCALGPPMKPEVGQTPSPEEIKLLADYQKRYSFFTGQYYGSFGTAQPTQFPWTSLGYTFDWAFEPVGLGQEANFVQFGESEYVVPKGASLTVTGVYTTSDYCGINKP